MPYIITHPIYVTSLRKVQNQNPVWKKAKLWKGNLKAAPKSHGGFPKWVTSILPTVQSTVMEKHYPCKAKQKVYVDPTLCVLHIRVPLV